MHNMHMERESGEHSFSIEQTACNNHAVSSLSCRAEAFAEKSKYGWAGVR